MLKSFTIFTPTFISLFWTVFFFLNRKQNSRSQNIWMIVMGLITISMAISAFYWYSDENYALFCKLDILEGFTTLSFVPVMFLYFKELTGDKKRSLIELCLLFFPPIFLGGISFAMYLFVGEDQSVAYYKAMIENQGNINSASFPFPDIRMFVNEYAYSIFLFMQSGFVFFYAVRRLLVYRRHLGDFFSDIEGKDMEHHWAVVCGLLVLLLFTFIVAVSGHLLYIEYTTSMGFILTFIGVILFYVCFHVFCSNYTADGFAQELKRSDNEALECGIEVNEERDPDVLNSLKEKILPQLTRVMTEDKVFLNKELRIDDIAHMILTNRTYISRLIHDEFGCNFSEYVNKMRIEYAKELIQRNPKFTQEYIASMSGFSYQSSFSRTFKKHTGMTFREWQKKL